MLTIRHARRVAAALALLTPGACGDANSAATLDDARGGDAAADALVPDGGPDAEVTAAFVASCSYTNAFSDTPECREYRGAWSEVAARADCEAVFFGAAGTYAAAPCELDAEIGRCSVGDVAATGTVTVSTGDGTACDTARLACENFAGGAFAAAGSCGGGAMCEAPLAPTAATFEPPYLDCKPPRAGEPAGAAPDGQVCTMTMISASTEPGRYYPDYADCDVVRRQRPYYGARPATPDSAGDPRLADAGYMAEVAWLTGQVRASACTCCHDSGVAPDGAAVWDITAGPLWIDTVSDEALAMLVGLTDSRYFGFYPPEGNNGFDRTETGLPTTDVARLKAFGKRELERRGLTEAEAATLPPFAPFFRELVVFAPEPCPEGVGVDANGGLRWDGVSARYLSVLRAGSASPGVQPNYDLPEGTLWAIAADPAEPSMACGMVYGEVPAGAYQRFPDVGEAPEPLVSGERYYLHVQRDLAVPVTRCLFVAP